MSAWILAAGARVVEHGGSVTIVQPGGLGAHRLDGDSAALARVVMATLGAPADRAAILRAVSAAAGVAPAEVPVGPIDELIALLAKSGAIEAAPLDAPAGGGARVLLGVSGAVAAVDTPELIRRLQARGHEVRVAMTAAARRFVAPLALEALTHAPVVRSMWQRGGAEVPHLELAGWADVVLVAPASAQTLGRLAAGDFADVVSAVAQTTRAPVVVAPSMNGAMLASAPVRAHLEALRARDGWHVVHPTAGHEVADAPVERRLALGPTPGPAALVDVVTHVLGERLRETPPLPAWQRAWQLPGGAAAQPWHSDALDDDLAAALAELLATAPPGAPRRRLVDLGCGAGTIALAAAARGYEVVAIDAAPAAVEAARARAGSERVTWLVDDAVEPRLAGRFDVLVDRGLFHVVPAHRRDAYARTLARLAAPGATLLLKVHAAEAAAGRSRPPADAELAALLGEAFTPASAEASRMPGAREAPAARLYRLVRRH